MFDEETLAAARQRQAEWQEQYGKMVARFGEAAPDRATSAAVFGRGEQALTMVDRGELVVVGAGVAAGFDERTQHAAAVRCRLVCDDVEERAAGPHEAEHSGEAGLHVGGEVDHVKPQAEIDAAIGG